MANFANSLKGEIARVARKEVKSDLLAIRKTVGAQRSEIATLKKQIKDLIANIKKAPKEPRPATAKSDSPKSAPGRKRQPPGPATLTNFREKVGISQTQLAKLLGVSIVSVYKWEAGKTRPRAAQVGKILEVVKLGKRAVAAQLSGKTQSSEVESALE